MPYEPLTRSRITQALRRLGVLAQEEGLTLEFFPHDELKPEARELVRNVIDSRP